MVISKLANLYDILSKDNNVEIAPMWMSPENPTVLIILNTDGDIVNIQSLKGDDKTSKTIYIPFHLPRSNNPLPHLLCDKMPYVLGFTLNKENCEKHFAEFKKKMISFLGDIDSPDAKAVVRFLEKWDPTFEKAIKNPVIAENIGLFKDKPYIIFKLDGFETELHETPKVLQKWHDTDKFAGLQTLTSVTSGKKEPIAPIHSKIPGIGDHATLVSFNDKIHCVNAYGHEGFENGPVGLEDVFKYTTALSYLMLSDDNCIRFGDTRIVFWAQTKNGTKIAETANDFFSGPERKFGKRNKKTEKHVETEKTTECNEISFSSLQGNKLRDAFIASKLGLPTEIPNIDENVDFYILTLKPHTARICICDWIESSVPKMFRGIYEYFVDAQIQNNLITDLKPPYPFFVVRSVAPFDKDDKILSKWMSSMIHAILNGSDFPAFLYQAALNKFLIPEIDENKNKIRTERSTRKRNLASFIKAYLKRHYRNLAIKEMEDIYSMSLNKETTYFPYLFGRLIALAVKLQRSNNPQINTTIADRFLTAASRHPKYVFAFIMDNIQKNLSANKNKYYIKNEILDVIKNIDELPDMLTAAEQGSFMLGYYQQLEYDGECARNYKKNKGNKEIIKNAQ